MDNEDAVINLFALAHPGRLNVFRTIVAAGSEGLAAGKIAKSVGMPANTASTHLSILTGAGLLSAYRDGRSIIYQANFAQMGSLLTYLVKDACANDPVALKAFKDALAGKA
jgi:ArsR family transcriptional regulator, arsenate/arsenite/antimonite-responsive transcriptional repressor